MNSIVIKIGNKIGNRMGNKMIANSVKINAATPSNITPTPVATNKPRIKPHITTTEPTINAHKPAPMAMTPPSSGKAMCQATTKETMISKVIPKADSMG